MCFRKWRIALETQYMYTNEGRDRKAREAQRKKLEASYIYVELKNTIDSKGKNCMSRMLSRCRCCKVL